MFVVPLDLAAVVDAACTKALDRPGASPHGAAARGRGHRPRPTPSSTTPAPPSSPCCADGPPLPGRAFTPLVAQLQQQVLLAEGKPYEARVSLTNRILLQLSIEGHIVRTRPLGSWLSSQYRWTTVERWFAAPWPPIPPTRRAPSWCAGGCARTAPGRRPTSRGGRSGRRSSVVDALDELGAVAVTVEPAPGGSPTPAWVLPDDSSTTTSTVDGPVVSLLPSLDPAIMGWKEREWILDGLGPQLFDRNGNAGPIVLVDGAAVGVWAQLDGGRVVTELLRPVSATGDARLIAAAADRADRLVRRRARDASLPDAACNARLAAGVG